MPSANVISLNDGTNVVPFSPDAVSATHVVYQNLSEGVLANRELMHYDRPASGKDVRRSVRINTPVEVTLADGSVVTKIVTFKGELISPKEVPAAARTRCRVLGAAALVHADTVKVFDNPEWVW